jgi:hypothetical protein
VRIGSAAAIQGVNYRGRLRADEMAVQNDDARVRRGPPGAVASWHHADSCDDDRDGDRWPHDLAKAIDEAGHDGTVLHQALLAIKIDVDRTIGTAAVGVCIVMELSIQGLDRDLRSVWMQDAPRPAERLCGKLDLALGLS